MLVGGLTGLAFGALNALDNSLNEPIQIAYAGDPEYVLDWITVTAKRPVQDLVRVSWYNFGVGMLNNLAYAGLIENKYEIWNGEVFKKLDGNQTVPTSLNGPAGFGSTGRNVAKSLNEKLMMEEVISNPYLGSELPIKLGDPRWTGWSKMQ